MRTLLLTLLLVVVIITALWPSDAADSGTPGVTTLTGRTMGTGYTVRLAEPLDAASRAAAQAAVDAALDGVVASMSTWEATSELSRLNRSTSTQAVPASAALIEVLGVAADVSAASDGAFDVTVGPLVDAWGFGPGGRERPFVPPTDGVLAHLLTTVGYDKVRVDRAAGTVRKAVGDLRVDLSAIAKGYGVDVAADALQALGHRNYVVEIGGEVVARGARGDRPWRVGIARPRPAPPGVYTQVSLGDAAMATSGDSYNRTEYRGHVYSHTLDPRTGRPVEHALASVTVIADRCVVADAWATALSVVGPDAGLALAERQELAALFLSRGLDGAISEVATDAFEAYRSQAPGGRGDGPR